MERKAYTAFGEFRFGKTGRHHSSTAFAVNLMLQLSDADGPSESQYNIVQEHMSHLCIAGWHRSTDIHNISILHYCAT